MKKLQEIIYESKVKSFDDLQPGDKIYSWWYNKDLKVYTVDHIDNTWIYGTCDKYENQSPEGLLRIPDRKQFNSNINACKDEDGYRYNYKNEEVFFSCPKEVIRVAKLFIKHADEEREKAIKRADEEHKETIKNCNNIIEFVKQL